MAGHSKWANTKYRKAAQDTKRSKIFTKIIRELVTATRLGGNDPLANPRLRIAIDKALSNNMTRNTINKAISRGISNNYSTNMETLIYEGYGPGGTAMIVECLSDNRNRTIAKIRSAFNKYGGNLSTGGSVAYLFKKIGILVFEQSDENYIMKIALENSAEDIVSYNDTIIVYTTLEKMHIICNILEMSGIKANHTTITMIPSIKINMDKETPVKLLHLIDMLEDYDDVQEVYHNGNLSNEVRTTSF